MILFIQVNMVIWGTEALLIFMQFLLFLYIWNESFKYCDSGAL